MENKEHKKDYRKESGKDFRKNIKADNDIDAAEQGNDEPNVNLIEGRNVILEAMRSGTQLDRIFIQEGLRDNTVASIIKLAKQKGVIFDYVKKERLSKLSPDGNHQGVVAYAAAYDYVSVEDILAIAEKKGEPVTDRDEALERFNYRLKWEDDFRAYVKKLAKKKHVIICGDMNVAHQEVDLKNPKPNRGNCGFTDEEREKMTALLDSGFTDTFRYKYPDREDAYSWWSYRFNARANNSGWRIDYFLVDDDFAPKIKDAAIHPEIEGSDHCPVELLIDCTL